MKRLFYSFVLILICNLIFFDSDKLDAMFRSAVTSGASVICDVDSSSFFNTPCSDWSNAGGDGVDCTGNVAVFDNSEDIWIYNTNAVTSIKQWAMIELDDINTGDYIGVVLRAEDTSASNNSYVIVYSQANTQVEWWQMVDGVYTALVTASVWDVTFNDGDYLGVSIEGTGSNTVVRLWKAPDLESLDCPQNWGSIDYTFEDDPGNKAADSGLYTGVYGYDAGADTTSNGDNFYSGDWGF
jgi:hypothetical protein